MEFGLKFGLNLKLRKKNIGIKNQWFLTDTKNVHLIKQLKLK